MFEITPENAETYLRERGFIGPGSVRVTELADGVSNAVLRIETAAGPFVLKQSRPQLRTREAWFSDIGRVWRERDAMRLLRPLLPPGAVPEVLFSDEANFAFAMSHAPEPFLNWRSVLLNGEVDLALGESAGRLLGVLHESTALLAPSPPASGGEGWDEGGESPQMALTSSPQPSPPQSRGSGGNLDVFRDRTVFEQLRVDPFYVRVQQRIPDLTADLAPLIERCRSVQLGLCHGDFSPKNLLVHAGGFTLVDYETCHLGDVTFDLGFFLSHLLLKAVYRWPEREQYFDLTRAFWRGYGEVVTFAPLAELMVPGIAHSGVCLLARVDGTSPAPYLIDETKRDVVRRLGRRLLRENPTDWDDVLQMCDNGAP
jgi:5-methylthioribose kinase